MRENTEQQWNERSFHDALSDIRLSMLTRGSPIVIVVGAGCSCESGVPLGNTIRQTAEKVLPEQWSAFKLGQRPKTLEAFLDFIRSNIPGDSQRFVARLLADAGIPRADDVTVLPTLLHMLVARLIAGACTPLVVSLNFDELLERCIGADIGPPGKLEDALADGATRWILCATPTEWHQLRAITRKTAEDGPGPCVILKPHGTISRPETLVAAGRDVAHFPEPVEELLTHYLQDPRITFLFLGCSFRDTDFYNLYQNSPPIKARVVVLECASLKDWLRVSREVLPNSRHPFDLESFNDCQIVFATCRDGRGQQLDVDNGEVAPQSFLRQRTCTNVMPGKALLQLMASASGSTGHLREQNAPWVTDIQIHDWVRDQLVGVRPALESFLATEILIGAAVENGTFTKERLLRERRHLEQADRHGYDQLLSEILARYLQSGVLVEDTKGRYALCRLRGAAFSDAIAELLGPLRAAPDGVSNGRRLEQLRDLVNLLAEQKATRSQWLTQNPGDLVEIERATTMVLDTTDELFVVSEYGTWMRRDRFRNAFREAVARGKGQSVRVIIASPPPLGSQGYIEWICSALWLWTQPAVVLYVLDDELHKHHMNLGQQVGIDFKREGTSNELVDSRIRFGTRDKNELRGVFAALHAKSQTFVEWQLEHGLGINFGNFGIQFLLRHPLSSVVLQHDPRYDSSVSEPQRKDAELLWDRTNERRSREGKPPLEAKPLFRPCEAALAGECLVIKAGQTTYFDNHYRQRESRFWDADRVVGAGISVVPVCSDHSVLLGKRASVVESGEGRYHVAAGHAHPKTNFRAAHDTLCAAAYDELWEEMHISKEDIVGLDFIGIAIDLTRSKPEFVVVAKLRDEGQHYVGEWSSDSTSVQDKYGAMEEFMSITTLQELLACDAQSGGDGHEPPFSMSEVWKHHDQFVPACHAALMAFWLLNAGLQAEGIDSYLSLQ